jgi:energy-coupling factor transporter transmembrane protein EcfT
VAELTACAYHAGTSILHRMDVRMKLVLTAAASLVSLRLEVAGAGLMTLALLGAGAASRRSLRIHPGEWRWIGLMLVLVFTARALSAEGTPVFSIGSMSVTQAGLREGALAGLRLAAVFALGTLLITTTRSTEIRTGVEWFLRPLPFVSAGRIGTMLGLLVRFIPVIFEELSQASDAQRARAAENRRNPLRRAVKLGVPALSRILQRSDRLALAMEARCYSEQRTPAALSAGWKDWGALALGGAWLSALLAM